MMTRRQFLKASLAAGCGLSAASVGAVEGGPPGAEGKLILSAPLTHSDWMLKPGIAWGAEGVRHMLDVCKECGWSRIYWRGPGGGRGAFKKKMVRGHRQRGEKKL